MDAILLIISYFIFLFILSLTNSLEYISSKPIFKTSNFYLPNKFF